MPSPVDRYTGEMMGLLEVCSDKALQSAAWNQIASYAADLGEASAAWERAIACARAAREEPGLGLEFGVATDRDYVLGSPLWSYADVLIEHGEFERAEPLLTESARLFQVRGNRYRIADSLGTVGRLALLQGDLTKAYALLHEAVTLGRAVNYQRMLGEFQSVLGLVTLYGGDVPAARRLLMDSLRLCLDLNDGWFSGRVCTYLAETALWEGKLDEAERWLAQSLGYHADPLSGIMDQVQRLFVAARLASAQGAYLRAATLFGSVEGACSQIHYEPAGPARQLAGAALATVQAALGAELFDEAFAAGQQLSLDRAFSMISASSSVTDTSLSLSQLPA